MGPKFFVQVAAGSFKADLLREGIEFQERLVIIREYEVIELKENLGKLPKKLRPRLQPVALSGLGTAGRVVAPPCSVSVHTPVVTEAPEVDEILCALLTRRSLWWTC